MDPITLVVTAVALGASAGLTDTAAQMVKDAYAGLKALLSRREVDVSAVERRPDSANKQGSLREDLDGLAGTEDALDDEVLDAARKVVAAVKAHDPAAGAAIGIDLGEFQAASLRVSGLTSEGTGVRGKNWNITGDTVFENIHAGRPTGPDQPAGGADPSAR